MKKLLGLALLIGLVLLAACREAKNSGPEKKTSFTLHNVPEHATAVFMLGSFVDWMPSKAIRLSATGTANVYEASVALTTGDHDYKYYLGDAQGNFSFDQGEDIGAPRRSSLTHDSRVSNGWSEHGNTALAKVSIGGIRISAIPPTASAAVHIAGTLTSWDEPHQAMEALADGSFAFNLNFVTALTVYPDTLLAQYKFTRDGLWSSVEQDADGNDISNRRLFAPTSINDVLSVSTSIARWADEKL